MRRLLRPVFCAALFCLYPALVQAAAESEILGLFQRWQAAHGQRSGKALEGVYAPRLDYYGLSAAQVLQAFDAQTHTVAPAPRASAVCKDPDDQQFIDLAVQHGAILLSKDQAVLRLRKRLMALGVEAMPSLQTMG